MSEPNLTERSLADFLSDHDTNFANRLPLIHTTSGVRLLNILSNKRITCSPCNVFNDESLLYFFLGRPAYKYRNIVDPADWELPVAFVFSSGIALSTKRIFPFDSGAVFNYKPPTFMSDFKREDFDVGDREDAVDRLVETFFGDEESYLAGKTRPEAEFTGRYHLGVRDFRARAVTRLYNRDDTGLDERRMTIEVQSDSDVSVQSHLLSVVIPRCLLDDDIAKAVRALGAKINSYEIYPLSSDAHFYAIYQECQQVINEHQSAT